MIKTLRKLGIEGNFLNLKKGIVKTLQVTSLRNERLKLFPEGYPLSLLICNIVQDVLRFPGGDSGKEPTCQCRRHKRHGFDTWVGKIPWRRATHSSILAWRIPWTEEPGGLQPIGSQRVRHD